MVTSLVGPVDLPCNLYSLVVGDECRRGFDCFSSPLNFDTIFTRDMDPVDCDREEDFNSGGGQIIVNCMKFVDPNAANWLMHLAISHSLWLLVRLSGGVNTIELSSF